jgi:WhiB family redox-sensing transcriptional regulator
MQAEQLFASSRQNPPWMRDAACRASDTSLFYPAAESDSGPAVAICAECPVRALCLDEAVRRPELFGIWGGTTESERRIMRRNDRLKRAGLGDLAAWG